MATSVAESDVSRVYHGDLDNLPQQESNVVRIFLSSTFTDFAEERNLLYRETFQRLQNLCQERGFDFQVADMRWGVRDDAQVAHKTTDLVIKEIIKSKHFSRATYFVAFLGCKYGSRLYPDTISEKEFAVLLHVARTEGKAALLEKWYKKDENYVPPVFCLLPITSQFPFYDDETEENEQKRKEDQDQWNAVDQLLANTFRQAASLAYKCGMMSAERKHVYYRSVTEAEVAEGILDCEGCDNRTICFRRELYNVKHSDKLAGRFEDLDGGLPDTEANDLLEDLKTKSIPRRLTSDNIIDDKVQWTEKGIDPENNEHSEYLNRFSETFYNKVSQQIIKSTEHFDVPLLDNETFQEILHHAHFCNRKAETFCGRQDILKAIKVKMMQLHCKEEMVIEEVELPNDEEVPVSAENKEAQTPSEGDDVPDDARAMAEAGSQVQEVMEESNEASSSEKSKDVEVNLNESIGRKDNEDDSKVTTTMEREESDKVAEERTSESGQEENGEEDDFQDEAADKLTDMKETHQRQNGSQNVGPNVATELGDLPTDDPMEDMTNMPELTEFHKQIILTGESGSGKTALLAKVTTLLPKWFGTTEIVRIVRFLGTSPKAGNIKDVITSVCQQIIYAYDLKEVIPDQCSHDISMLYMYFYVLLCRIDTKSKPLVIILDSVDQLSEEYNVFSMNWMPVGLPPGVHLIISMLPQKHSCLANARKQQGDKGTFLDIPTLSRDIASDILNGWLSGCSKTLTPQQKDFILNHFLTCSQPLYLKVSFEQAKYWSSYTPSQDWILGLTITSAIEQVYSRLEKMHGQILVSKALGYLTASKGGLTDGEMEDVLSIDDEVLQDTYLYHLPPNPEIIRLPPLLWSRVRFDLMEYLCQQTADAKSAVNWYHRQFRETAVKRYLYKDVKKCFHNVLSEYFDGKWANLPKPLELYKKKKGNYPNALRGVPSQCMAYGKGKWNLRKLSEYPYHLLHAQRYEEFVQNCCSFEWLSTKVMAVGILPVLHDLTAAICVMKASILASGKPNRAAFVTENDEDQELDDKEKSVVEGSEEKSQAEVDEELTMEELTREASGTLEAEIGNLSQLVLDTQEVYDVLQLSFDVLRKDAQTLATQILGQLGHKENASKVLEKLRVDAENWVRSTKTPVLYPITHCLPSPGKWLCTTSNISVCFSGDAPEDEQKFSLSKDGNVLYAAERKHKGGDNLKFIDVNKYNSFYQQKLRDISVRSLQVVCNDRFLLLETYTVRDKYSPRTRHVLYDLSSNKVTSLPPDTTILAFSKEQPFLVMVGGGINQDFLPGTEPDVPVLKAIAQLYNVDTKKPLPLKVTVKANVKVTQAVLSDDEDTLVLLGESKFLSAYVFTRESDGKYRHIKTNLLESGDTQFTFGNKNKMPMKILVDNRLAFAGNSHQTNMKLFLSDLLSGEIIRDFQLSEHYAIDKMEASKDLSTLLLCSTSSVVINGDTRKPITVVDAVHCRIKCVCEEEGPYLQVLFCGDRKDLMLASRTGSPGIAVWYVGSDSVDGICLFNIYGHSESPTYLQMTVNNKNLITASPDNTLRVWSLERIIQSCTDVLESVSEHMNAAYGGDKKAIERIRETLAEDVSKPHAVNEGQQLALCTTVSKNGKVAAVGTNDCWVIFYDLSAMKMISYHKEGRKVVAMLTTQSGSYIVSAARDIKLWDPETGSHIRTLEHGGKGGGQYSGSGGGEVTCLAEASDILVGGYAGMECYGVLWDLKTGQIMKQLQGLYGFQTVGITSDAKTVVSTLFDFPMIFDVSSGQPLDLGQPDTMMSGTSCLRISPDDKLVVTCSTDGTVRVCDIKTGKYLHNMRHTSSAVDAIFTQDSGTLLTAGFKKVLVWSMKTGQLLNTLLRHQDFVTCMKFCHNDQFLVTASKDKEIVIWDFKEKVSIASFIAHCPLMSISVANDLSSILFSPEQVAYLGVLKPNRKLRKIIKGQGQEKVEETVQKAQAFALAFSSQRVADKSSRACSIL